MAATQQTWAALLLPLLILASHVAPITPQSSRPISEREWRAKKSLCYENIDNGLWGWHCRSSNIVRENCALRCVSAACYNEIYGNDPLEEGEVDIRRGRQFKYCVQRESMGESISGKSFDDY
eukprot:c14427_g1_i1 orf=169-534(+)